jgi:Tol biopolymer transport system component
MGRFQGPARIFRNHPTSWPVHKGVEIPAWRILRAGSIALIGSLLLTASAAAGTSPSGEAKASRTMVAYELSGKGPDHIYTSALDGSHRTLLVKGRDPAWSPDGNRLTYRTGNPQRGGGIPTKVHVIRADGTHARVFEPKRVYGEASGEAGPIVWSPNGRWLAFDTLGGIYVMRPNGNDLRLVTKYPGHDLACYDLEPSWSPDGKNLVFAVLCDGGNLGLWTVGIDGKHRTELLPTKGPFVAAYQPTWSPDGNRIAFVGVRKKRHKGYGYDLYTIHRDGGGLTKLTTGSTYPSAPAWSPDGRRLSFTVYGRGIFVMRRDGSGFRQLGWTPKDACCLAWDPAG